MRRRAVTFLILFLHGAAAAQTTWFVAPGGSGDGSSALPLGSLATAVDAAADGDTILVRPGTYFENVEIVGRRRLFIRSDADGDPSTRDLAPSATILDGNQEGVVVLFRDTSALIEGFTVTHGLVDLNVPAGLEAAGIHCSGSLVIIRHNIVVDNHVGNIIFDTSGAGIGSVGGGFTLIEDNWVMDNTMFAGHGAGIGMSSAGVIRRNVVKRNTSFQGIGGGISAGPLAMRTVLVEGNVIQKNKAPSAGGIRVRGSTSPGAPPVMVRHNVIVGNSANVTTNGEGCGGGASVTWADVANNLIANNSAFRDGGGLDAWNAVVRSNTIVENSADGGGGGIRIHRSRHTSFPDAQVGLIDSIVWGNSASGFGNELRVTADQPGCMVNVEYSCLKMGRYNISVSNNCRLSLGAGIVSENPRFVSEVRDEWTLRGDSPCLDRGDPTFWGSQDLAGNPRVLDGLLDGNARVDMGCYEFNHLRLELTGNPVPGGMVTLVCEGTAGLPAILLGGTQFGVSRLDAFGTLFLDLSSPWALLGTGIVPFQLDLPISVDAGLPDFFVFQGLAYEAPRPHGPPDRLQSLVSRIAGTTSNWVSLDQGSDELPLITAVTNAPPTLLPTGSPSFPGSLEAMESWALGFLADEDSSRSGVAVNVGMERWSNDR